MTVSIAIDGPAGAGKSTVAKKAAYLLGYTYIDTGSMYRAITYLALEQQADPEKEEEILPLLQNLEIEWKQENGENIIYINRKNAADAIRTPEVTASVSAVSAHPLIRERMVEKQRELAASGSAVLDGRDIGTTVLPNAEVKIYMTASVEERARRRHEENKAKGMESNLETIQQEIAERDLKDSTREVSPLIKADDAVELDTTKLSIDEAVEKILEMVKERTFKA
ncbi:cytidylate kinase [Sinobaca qinghaiensis]|uniref:Cytidylate kinase n=2 Tax=Sinobaca qinghaiensis TaxID=342944 RepID=A0A419V345_9BACL|nr:cytidylate kinase [Sinobaca qinghaiensis]